MAYYARNDNVGVYLSKTEQMDQYLEKGCSIYEAIENGDDVLVATPEDGYLSEKPTIGYSGTVDVAEKNRSDIEYIAMMTGVDLDIS